MQVLVVCTANVARSPLAAAMLSTSLPQRGIHVASAGTHARPGHRVAERSTELARHLGLDVGSHRSRPVTTDLLAESNLVLTMTVDQRERCVALLPQAAERCFTLRELARVLAHVDDTAAQEDPIERLTWLTGEANRLRGAAPRRRRSDDVKDPIGRPWRAWLHMGATLDRCCERLVTALGLTPGWRKLDAGARRRGSRG